MKDKNSDFKFQCLRNASSNSIETLEYVYTSWTHWNLKKKMSKFWFWLSSSDVLTLRCFFGNKWVYLIESSLYEVFAYKTPVWIKMKRKEKRNKHLMTVLRGWNCCSNLIQVLLCLLIFPLHCCHNINLMAKLTSCNITSMNKSDDSFSNQGRLYNA